MDAVEDAMVTSTSPAAVRAASARAFFFLILIALCAMDDSVMERTRMA
jgi:hypothetical protein